MRYISLIESFYPSFSKQENKVANYILKEKENISVMSLQEITKKIAVSEATIVRFVRKLGFKGFIDFKLEIAKETSIVEEIEGKDYIDNISINIKRVIDATNGLMNKENVDKSIKLIDKSDKLYCFGMGASGVAAEELQNRLMRFGKISLCASDCHFQTMYASIGTKKDVVVVISLSGETYELIYPLTLAKDNGCKIIAITSYILSPIAKLADVVILTSSKETPLDGGSLIAKISQLYVIDVLSTGYALLNRKKSQEVKRNMAKAIAGKNKE